jgi:sec-independent protein translocase protein TatC
MNSEEKKTEGAPERGAASEAEGSDHEAGGDRSDDLPAGGNGTRDDAAPETAAAGVEEQLAGSSSETPRAEQEPAVEPKPAPNTEPRKPTYYDDHEYPDNEPTPASKESGKPAAPQAKSGAKPPPPPPPPTGGDGGSGDDDDEEGMARMSFLEHLDELRTRLLHSIYGLGIVYLACLIFAKQLFEIVAQPFLSAVKDFHPPLMLTQLTVMESFYVEYLKVPLVFGIFVAAPWLMYQAWGFISPGLYRRERRWATPFILSTAALFVIGGVFGYFIALRFAIAFLVGVGVDLGIQPMISVDSYFNMAIAIILGLGVVFQMPVVIFFLTLIRLVTPKFLLNNVRYAILIIFVLAAAITPTPDVFNMIVFAGPMILLFYVGIFASYLLVLSREGRKMPRRVIVTIVLVLLAAAAGGAYYMHAFMGYQFIQQFPWIVAPK